MQHYRVEWAGGSWVGGWSCGGWEGCSKGGPGAMGGTEWGEPEGVGWAVRVAKRRGWGWVSSWKRVIPFIRTRTTVLSFCE